MTWLLLAGCTALFEALKDVASKQSLKNLDEYVVLWAFTGWGRSPWFL
ncbi:MAG: EamA family transporter, partial [Synechococcales cyanobacterium RU_4_20]|nr:EamA family transporter [Synechococcales cyanobacterium RU_4_20]